MTNEEFRKKNNDYILNLMTLEDSIFNDVKGIIGNIKLPKIAYTVAERIHEVFNTMEVPNERLDQSLTAVLETRYLINVCQAFMQNLNSYVSKFIVATESNDIEAVKELMSSKGNFETFWDNMDNYIRSIDLYSILDKIEEAKMPLPEGITSEIAKKICANELKKVNYQPQKKPEEAHFEQVM